MQTKPAALNTKPQKQQIGSTEGNHLISNRREFLRAAAGTGLALAASPLRSFADHHGHPSPNSISYLDRRMYIRNMELLAHLPGEHRNGKMQIMSIGNRRYLYQQGDVIDISDASKPTTSLTSRHSCRFLERHFAPERSSSRDPSRPPSGLRLGTPSASTWNHLRRFL